MSQAAKGGGTFSVPLIGNLFFLFGYKRLHLDTFATLITLTFLITMETFNFPSHLKHFDHFWHFEHCDHFDTLDILNILPKSAQWPF